MIMEIKFRNSNGVSQECIHYVATMKIGSHQIPNLCN